MSAEVDFTEVWEYFFLYSLDCLHGNCSPVRSGDHRLVLYMVGSTAGWLGLLRLVLLTQVVGLQAYRLTGGAVVSLGCPKVSLGVYWACCLVGGSRGCPQSAGACFFFFVFCGGCAGRWVMKDILSARQL